MGVLDLPCFVLLLGGAPRVKELHCHHPESNVLKYQLTLYIGIIYFGMYFGTLLDFFASEIVL